VEQVAPMVTGQVAERRVAQLQCRRGIVPRKPFPSHRLLDLRSCSLSTHPDRLLPSFGLRPFRSALVRAQRLSGAGVAPVGLSQHQHGTVRHKPFP
jgi:hypothetical protein